MRNFTLPLLLLAAAASGLAFQERIAAVDSPSSNLGDSDLVVYPYGLMDAVRDTEVTVPMQVQLYNPGENTVELESLVVQTPEGQVLDVVKMDDFLVGDDGFVQDLYLKLEMIDPDISHRHSKRQFIPLKDYVALSPEAEGRTISEVIDGVRDLQSTGAPQMKNVRFELDLSQLFGPESEPGDVVPVEIIAQWNGGGASQTATIVHNISKLTPFMPPPYAGRASGTWVTGDMHVHNCRDEAVGGCDSCAAESFNLTGSFTNADLKPQFQALGMDFFSSTTHSYCINSDNEFNAVVAESQALTDATFVMLASTEISGAEAGPQSGSDSADLLCSLGWGAHDVHHMGGHNLSTRKPGGQDGFLDFCDNPMSTQFDNSRAVFAEGGFTSINHPNSGSWAFNSVNGIAGQERNRTWGVEVWNGSEGDTIWQGYQRNWWLDRLNEGKLLYPYSGSDTHDTATNFGAVHTFVPGALDGQSLTDALMGGRSYLSNGPFLELSIATLNGARSLPMGGKAFVQRIPANISININVDYNCMLDSEIVIYRGTVGGGEVEIYRQNGYNGGGSVQIQDVVPTTSFWYRADINSTQFTQNAMTTPVYVWSRN
ncbi:MAG: CehA/McbA family metallohydrolase [Planctomycetota bacterium]|nr:CehA/McbA family metallohydrolase [Planctomycetota bacterium]